VNDYDAKDNSGSFKATISVQPPVAFNAGFSSVTNAQPVVVAGHNTTRSRSSQGSALVAGFFAAIGALLGGGVAPRRDVGDRDRV